MASNGNGRTSRPYTKADWTDFAHIGPGTLAGEYMRRFWHPVIRTEDLPPGRAMPIRILGEDLTLYRGEGTGPHPARLPSQAGPASPTAMGEGSQRAPSPAAAGEGGGEGGKPHLLAFRCAHRGTQLSTGWVEGEDLRCFYHGWKYDPSGQCIEQPAELEPFCQKIRIRAYPAEDYLGLVFVYLGASRVLDPSGSGPQPVSPPDRASRVLDPSGSGPQPVSPPDREGEPPPLPRYPDIEEAPVREVIAYPAAACNYFNRLENAPDDVHLLFVHRSLGLSGLPTLHWEETEYGLHTTTTFPGGWHNEAHFMMPAITQFSGNRRLPEETRSREVLVWRLAIDDEHYKSFQVAAIYLPDEAIPKFDEQRARAREVSPSTAEMGEAVLAGHTTVDDIPRDRPDLFEVQDYVSQVGQGVIADRSHEHLGRTDGGVILLRKIWERELTRLATGRPLKQWTRPPQLSALLARA